MLGACPNVGIPWVELHHIKAHRGELQVVEFMLLRGGIKSIIDITGYAWNEMAVSCGDLLVRSAANGETDL